MSLLSGLLTVNDIVLDLKVNSKKRLFEEVAVLLENNNKNIDKDIIFQCLIAREKLGSTGLDNGVAIPHGRLSALTAPVACFIRLAQPVDFEAQDGKPVSLVFVMLVPAPQDDGENANYLKVLSHFAQKFSDKEIREHLQAAATAQEVLNLLI